MTRYSGESCRTSRDDVVQNGGGVPETGLAGGGVPVVGADFSEVLGHVFGAHGHGKSHLYNL